MDGTSIAAIIPTFRRWPYMLETVRMLTEQTRKPDEIIVVDQTPYAEICAKSREKLNEIISEHTEVKYYHLDEPRVYKARNFAAIKAQSETLLYLDDDIEMKSTFVGYHIRHYANPHIAAVVGSVFRSWDVPTTPVSERFLRASPVVQAFTYKEQFRQPLQGVGYMYANNFSVRADVFRHLRGWDEHILNYGDRDFGLRLCKAGYRIDYDPKAAIVHLVAPHGGTRVNDQRYDLGAWRRCVSIHYLAFRHLKGWMFIRYGLFRAARISFLLKRNVLNPLTWGPEFFGYLKAIGIARRWAAEGLKSPFPVDANGTNDSKPAATR